MDLLTIKWTTIHVLYTCFVDGNLGKLIYLPQPGFLGRENNLLQILDMLTTCLSRMQQRYIDQQTPFPLFPCTAQMYRGQWGGQLGRGV